MNSILETTNLCKDFKNQTVVNNVSLHVEKNLFMDCLVQMEQENQQR